MPRIFNLLSEAIPEPRFVSFQQFDQYFLYSTNTHFRSSLVECGKLIKQSDLTKLQDNFIFRQQLHLQLELIENLSAEEYQLKKCQV